MEEPGFDICFPAIWIAFYTKTNSAGVMVPSEDYLEDPVPTPNPSQVWQGAAIWQHIGNFGVKWQDNSDPIIPANFALRPSISIAPFFPIPGKEFSASYLES